MKQGIHPDNYRTVVFQDTSNNATFLTKSTAPTTQTIKLDDGNEYPLVAVHISSASHPFYTGTEKLVDIEGRVDRFKARTETADKLRSSMAAKNQKQQKRAQAKIAKRTTTKPVTKAA